MKFPFLSHSKSLDPKLPSSPPWPWPACGIIKTLSFRESDIKDDTFETFNSDFLETGSSSSRTFSTMSEEDKGDPVQTVFRGLRSDRFFFEPEQSSSLLPPLQGSDEKGCSSMEEREIGEVEILPMDSNDPYEDFRRSMEEMVEAHGLKDWQGFEELLGCYLKINGKNNHGYIVGAFIDLLISHSFGSSTSSSTTTTTTTKTSSSSCLSSTNNTTNYSSPSSPLSMPSSSLTTPCLSSILDHGDGDGEHDDSVDDDHVSS